jgi:glutamine---fructose-6-phosphate transaminase (isomerizing)
MEVVSQLEGAFALLIRSTRFPDELMAAKKGSPLLVGESPKQPPCQHPWRHAFRCHCACRESCTCCRTLTCSNDDVAATGLVEESAMMGRTRSELLSDVNQDTRPYRRQAHSGFEAYFSSDAAALVEHTRR